MSSNAATIGKPGSTPTTITGSNLECLGEAARKYRVSVHAYVLMTNHVHLLMTPASAAGLTGVMQTLGRRYVRYINHSYRWSGTLWEDR